MKIKKLKLYTTKLAETKEFYTGILGFELLKETSYSFTLKTGWTALEFEKSDKEHHYHFCFLIPSSLLHDALAWMENRTEIISIENDRKTQKFASWNAESFYFKDPNGNLAEFIVHYDLKSIENSFDSSKVLGVCEMGMPTQNIEQINSQLKSTVGSEFWKGDFDRFGTHGSIEGKVLLPNYTIKKTWFPTSIKITPFDFEASVEQNQKEYVLNFHNEALKISRCKL